LQVNRLCDADGHFIAGFLEGEAHFGITEANGGQSYGCFMSLRLRDDDAALVDWLRDATGIGFTRPVPARRTSKPQVEWRVQTQADCRTLAELLGRFPVRGRRRREVRIWRDAVDWWNSGVSNRALPMRGLRERLADSRLYRPPSTEVLTRPESRVALRAYLHGLLCAEGSFALRPAHTGMAVHMRRDERPLLEMLADALGIGYVRDQPASGSASPSATWLVARLADAVELASWLDPEMMRGRKAAELAIWLRAVDERRAARATGTRVAREHLDQLIAEFRSAREYRPGVLRSVGPEPPHEQTLAILRGWAETQQGPLSCSRYTAERQRGWPTRNTIARRFGSWDAALRAAGLEARLPRPEPRRVGGGARRKAHDEAQRERVLATLRYGVNMHGSLPTAMQFFRWRLVEAPATPTQATVYRLFPGGWPAVLAAYEASADRA
jgi:hypothetical protein